MTFVDITAPVEAIDKLMDILTRIGQAGGTMRFSEELWCGGETLSAQLSKIPENDDKVHHIQSNLRTLKDVAHTLRDLLSQCAEVTEKLHTDSMPFVLERGIHNLPDELLARVFEIAYKESFTAWTDVHPTSFQLVCSRFYRVSNSNPRIWNAVPLYWSSFGGKFMFFDTARLKLFLERSKQTPLAILMTPTSPSSSRFIDYDLSSQVQQLSSICARWMEVEIFIPDSDRKWYKFYDRHIFRNLQLHSLHNLKLRYPMIENTEPTEPNTTSSDFPVGAVHSVPEMYLDVFTTWHIPNLKCLVLHNVLPSFRDELPNLTRFELSLCTDQVRVWDSAQALRILANAPNLKHLSLTLRNATLTYSDNPTFAYLLELKTLKMSFQENVDLEMLEYAFFAYLRYSRVESIIATVFIDGTGNWLLPVEFCYAFILEDRFPRVTQFHLIHGYPRKKSFAFQEDYAIDCILKMITNVQNLLLDIPNLDIVPDFIEYGCELRQLRSLTLKGCTTENVESFEVLLGEILDIKERHVPSGVKVILEDWPLACLVKIRGLKSLEPHEVICRTNRF